MPRAPRPPLPPRPLTIRPHRRELRVDLALPDPDNRRNILTTRRITIRPATGTATVSSPDHGTRSATPDDDPEYAAFLYFTGDTDPWGAWAATLATAPKTCELGSPRHAIRTLTDLLNGKGPDTWLRELADVIFLDELGTNDTHLNMNVIHLAADLAAFAPRSVLSLIEGRERLNVLAEVLALAPGDTWTAPSPTERLRRMASAIEGASTGSLQYRIWSTVRSYSQGSVPIPRYTGSSTGSSTDPF